VPSADSRIQRESPTDATVTTHPSIITKVTVVPERAAENIVKVSLYWYRSSQNHAIHRKQQFTTLL